MKNKILTVVVGLLLIFSLVSCDLTFTDPQAPISTVLTDDTTYEKIETNITKTIEEVKSACVGISVTYKTMGQEVMSVGSGVIYKMMDGDKEADENSTVVTCFVITNEHVVNTDGNPAKYNVYLGNGKYIEADSVGSDAANDLAVLTFNVNLKEYNLKAISIDDEEDYREPAPKKQVKHHKYEDDEKDIKKQQEQAKTQAELNAERMAAVIKAVGLDKFTDLLEDIGDIKKQLANMQSNISDNIVIDLPAKLKDYHALFLKNGVDDIISYRLLKDIEARIEGKEATSAQIKSIAIDKLAELIPVEKSYYDVMMNKIVALAGPTGVGKTTTIAKIAATMTLKYGKKVCLITVDNFRIGAVEQLKTYAEIVNLPLYVATSPEELLRVVTKVKDKYDCVLIDSMGRGQFDTSQIAGIRDFFKVDSRITTALVLSMASNHIELYDTFERYEVLEPDYLIFTKLDETKYFGPLINIPVKKKLPLLLVTTGQNVPDDMEIPDGRKIAKRMLQEIPTLWSDK